MERLMTTEEVAEILRVEAVTVRRLVSRGELAAYRIAGEYRFTTTGIENFIESQRVVLNPATMVSLGKFTERARKALTLANEEANRYSHREIGPEHLLLAVMRIQDGIGARALSNLQVQLDEVRKLIEMLHPAEEPSLIDGQIGMSSPGKDTLELSVQEARSFGHHHIGTEHFLLALFHQEDSVAGLVLQKSGVTYEAARSQISQLLTANQA